MRWIFFWYGIYAEEIRTIQCNANERCRRGLDRGEHLLNESPQVHQKEVHPMRWIFFWYGIYAEEIRTI